MNDHGPAFDGKATGDEPMAAEKIVSLTTLATGVSHDLNNLLAAVLGHAAIMLRLLPQDSPLLENVQEVQDSTKQAMDIVRQLALYCGKGPYREQEVHLTTLVREMTAFIHDVAHPNMVLDLRLDDGLPPIRGDVNQLREMIGCLVQNAVDAMCDGNQERRLSLTTGTRHFTADELRHAFADHRATEGRYVFLEVADTGKGIDARHQTRLFDPGFSTQIRGRGMGLAVVFGVVRAHRGAIMVHSRPDAGARFTVIFPAGQ